MGTVVQLKNRINDTFSELKDSVDDKLALVEERIKNKLGIKVSVESFFSRFFYYTT